MSVTVLGSVNVDVVLSTPTIPRPGETLSATAKNLYSGGKGANQAIASARMRADVNLLGAVGDDDFGKTLSDVLVAEGVNLASLEVLDGMATGQAYICVSDAGENTIVVVPGANHAYRFKALPAQECAGRLVFLSQFEMPIAEIARFLKAADGGLRIINAAPAMADGMALFDDAEIIVVNETELSSFSDHALNADSSAQEIDAAARDMICRPDQWIIVTLGRKGARAVGGDETLNVAGYRVEAVDTTGAGDCFCGVLAAALSEGSSLRDALATANAAAALAVTKPGAGPAMPDRCEVMKFLKDRT